MALRLREADALTGLRTEQVAAAAKADAVEIEAAPIMYVAQLLGGTTEQTIGAVRDPRAIALTWAASAGGEACDKMNHRKPADRCSCGTARACHGAPAQTKIFCKAYPCSLMHLFKSVAG